MPFTHLSVECGANEVKCPSGRYDPAYRLSPPSRFPPPEYWNPCIDPALICDGINDCIEHEDESLPCMMCAAQGKQNLESGFGM